MPSPTIAPADLERLGPVLLRGLARRGHAVLVHVVVPDPRPDGRLHPDDEVELAVADLEPGAHPLEALVGLEAPAEWSALGVVALGTVRDAADAELVDARVRTVQLVERGGAWAVGFCPAVGDGPVATTSGPAGDRVPTGRVDDALRRALGLPTPGPTADTVELFALQWLDRLVDEAAGLEPCELRGCTERWAISRHPAVAALGLGTVTEAGLVAHGRRLATWRDWGQLRRMCAAGAWAHPELGADEAAWLDDGAFSRWALQAWPDLDALAQVAHALLPPRTAGLVDRTLAAWSLPVDVGGTPEHLEMH
jgi:hypothetical protein